MVAVVAWPYGVPDCIMPLSPQGGLQDNRVSFEPDVGPAIERPKSSWAPDVYSVQLVLISVPQFAEFERWYRSDLRHGVLPFEFRHPITKARSAWKIVKGNPAYQVTKPRLQQKAETRCISLSFTITAFPAGVPDGYLLQENGDYVLQENGDRIIVQEGVSFDGS